MSKKEDEKVLLIVIGLVIIIFVLPPIGIPIMIGWFFLREMIKD